MNTRRQIDTGTEQLLCSVDKPIATITLNRPEKHNALSDVSTPALRATLLRLESDSDARAVVIIGAGTGFCAGGDVTRMSTGTNQASDATPPPGIDEKIRQLQHRQEIRTCGYTSWPNELLHYGPVLLPVLACLSRWPAIFAWPHAALFWRRGLPESGFPVTTVAAGC